MKRYCLIFLIACCASNGTQAMPAYPHPVKIVTETDSFCLTLYGDECCKYAVTEDGYTALPDSCGWVYACINSSGEVTKSSYRVCSEHQKDLAVMSFLVRQPKGVFPSYTLDESVVRKTAGYTQPSASFIPITGNRRILIILMQYSDVKFRKTQKDFDRLFNEQGYREDGAYGSVFDYYNKVSYGQLQLQCDVLGPYTASHNMAYYGGNSGRNSNDTNPKALFDEAIRHAIEEVRLADYDSDGDGYVDNIHIIFAGYGEEAGASPNTIWSHEMTFRAERIDGMMIDRYSCSPELRGNSGIGISRIGAPCHEIGHALGANDYYDVDYQTGGYYEGTGNWDIMASGSWNDNGARPADFNPFVKVYNFGWVEIQQLQQDTVNIISPSTARNHIYQIETPATGDYFLVENRQSEGINSAEPGHGLLIFHVGPQLASKARTNTINATYPQQCYVVCASSKSARPQASASSYGDISSPGCPFPGTSQKTSFSSSTTPAALCFNGRSAEVSLTDITELGNRDIALFYSKADSGPVTPPDDPPDDNDDVVGLILWSDDFEISNYFRNQTWTNENLRGKGNWTIKAYSSNPSYKEPEAMSGNCYMLMEIDKSGTIMGSSSKYSCRTVSGSFALDAGDYVLTGKYGGFSTQRLTTDTLVVMVVDANDKCIASKSCPIEKIVEWASFKFPVHCAGQGEYRLTLTGVAAESSTIFADNLILYVPTESSVKPLPTDGKKEKTYSIGGTYLGLWNRHQLPPGTYIMNRRKVLIK